VTKALDTYDSREELVTKLVAALEEAHAALHYAKITGMVAPETKGGLTRIEAALAEAQKGGE
jgi:hypothetical protein